MKPFSDSHFFQHIDIFEKQLSSIIVVKIMT